MLDFGTSGNLRESDLVMWDRQTESWWQQAIGEDISPPLDRDSPRQQTSRVLPEQVHEYGEGQEEGNPDGREKAGEKSSSCPLADAALQVRPDEGTHDGAEEREPSEGWG